MEHKTPFWRNFLPQMPNSLIVSFTALMAALTAIMTMMFQIFIPATLGYFNLGEVGVYITALLFGPIIGALAGGIGSMTADILLGFPHYALATLVIKGTEGFVVGYLSMAVGKRLTQNQLRFLGVGVGIGLSIILVVIGTLRFSGELWLSGGPGEGWWLAVIFIPSWIWFLFAIYIAFATIILTFRYEPTTAWNATSMLLGGFVMILGYFLFQQFVLLFPAIIELPANLMQATAGITISLPVIQRIRRAFENSGWIS